MELINRFLKLSSRVQKFTIVRAIRDGLVNMIPVLTIGAFALIFMTFPVAGYQTFINEFGGGFINDFFTFINKATFGVLSVYMTFSISRSYMRIKANQLVVQAGAVFSSLLVFFMLSGSFLPTFNLDNMGPKSMLVALISGLGASALYLLFFNLLTNKTRNILSLGADKEFNRMLSTLIPITLVALSFAFTNLLIVRIFNVDSFRDFYIKILNAMFSVGDNAFFKGFFFVLLSSILWFFGVHGSDALEGVMQTYFAPIASENATVINSILTKEFFDCFVLMGGCGSAICLLIAILIFSRNRARKGLGITASVPMIFNINELMVFGLPIIFNPIMLIPFLLVPLVCYSVAYLALSTGIVPLIANSVEWTTPIILGGYTATGSIAGSFLQIINVLIGVGIYLPFVKLLDKESDRAIQENYDEFMDYFKSNERELQNIRLGDLNNIYSSFAKELFADIKHELTKNVNMYYQPQYNFEGQCLGVEALLRWKHPVLGVLYPPLVMKLVKDYGLTYKLEEAIFKQVLNDRDALLEKYGPNIHISINATGSSFASGQILELIKQIDKESSFKDKNIVIELTEQEAFSINDQTRGILSELKKMGVKLAIDDFSMGQTTLHYLRENIFDIIKIDGSLVVGLSKSTNLQEIVSSLIELADSLSLFVVAEYVENEEDREALHKMGCNCYQGFLYSKAIPLNEVNEN